MDKEVLFPFVFAYPFLSHWNTVSSGSAGPRVSSSSFVAKKAKIMNGWALIKGCD